MIGWGEGDPVKCPGAGPALAGACASCKHALVHARQEFCQFTCPGAESSRRKSHRNGCLLSKFTVVNFDGLGDEQGAPPLEDSLEILFSFATPPPSLRVEVTKR